MSLKTVLIGVAVVAVGYLVVSKAMAKNKTIIEDRGFEIEIEEQK